MVGGGGSAAPGVAPKTSVLKLGVGDQVRLSEEDFVRLFRAFFAELETRYL